jgi:hypothetical protein
MAVYPTVKVPALKPTRGETPVNSTHACFPPTHPYTITSVGRRVDRPSCGPVKKFTGASFFADIFAHLKTSKYYIYKFMIKLNYHENYF